LILNPNQLIISIIPLPLLFVKRYRRMNLLKALLSSDQKDFLKIAIFGSGWAHLRTVSQKLEIF
jgi:hypothetical protein